MLSQQYICQASPVCSKHQESLRNCLAFKTFLHQHPTGNSIKRILYEDQSLIGQDIINSKEPASTNEVVEIPNLSANENERFWEHMVMYFYTSGTPFFRVENNYLLQA